MRLKRIERPNWLKRSAIGTFALNVCAPWARWAAWPHPSVSTEGIPCRFVRMKFAKMHKMKYHGYVFLLGFTPQYHKIEWISIFITQSAEKNGSPQTITEDLQELQDAIRRSLFDWENLEALERWDQWLAMRMIKDNNGQWWLTAMITMVSNGW